MVEMDVALELEDDVFYADLSKQIALLIMDDDNEQEAFPLQYPAAVSFQAFCNASQPMTASPFYYEQASRREVRGTGVFIPRSSLPRRKHRAGRPRQSDKPKSAVSAAPNAPISSAAATNNGTSNSQKSFNYARRTNGLKKQLL
ncbi:hypothetical protein Taro_025832 [Colocasia esculenta]|uniref:Uncharacterized protein n=1 Tax=Colocasia esculenta TaxID=4460 RepID=A0A843VPG0_COLES|nr:hypothetical protein [Colocasia esculenta]